MFINIPIPHVYFFLYLMAHQYFNYDYGQFDYDKVLFVSPNGNDDIAKPGRIDCPWSTITGAVQYLLANATSDCSIIVFPGTYDREVQWKFNSDNLNTVIKFIGSVYIIQDSSPSPLIVSEDGGNVSLIGDTGSIKGNIGCYIEMDNTDSSTEKSGLSLGSNSSLIIRNLSLNSPNGNGIWLQSTINGSVLTLDNCSISGKEYNIFCGTRIISLKCNILNSYLYASRDAVASNIYIRFGGGDFSIRNSQIELAKSPQHIYMNSAAISYTTLNMSDVIFWADSGGSCILRDDSGYGSTNIRVTVTSDIVSKTGAFLSLGVPFAPLLTNSVGVISTYKSIQQPKKYLKN